MKIKAVKVTNHKNVVVQIPLLVVERWGLRNGDYVEFDLTEDGTLTLAPVCRENKEVISGGGGGQAQSRPRPQGLYR